MQWTEATEAPRACQLSWQMSPSQHHRRSCLWGAEHTASPLGMKIHRLPAVINPLRHTKARRRKCSSHAPECESNSVDMVAALHRLLALRSSPRSKDQRNQVVMALLGLMLM
eukprot:TRINITY_DN24484_c0_g1_i4.p1 TRINITY_DN24484_c0_g1~~TRINITY_DN24484_c0_g1_i4.p1  ORF type:complete len:112 (-),score=1.54 TRINITY_DN24484_c0_g1_i4:30-365(-)